jgi:hypothetical protein
MKSLRLLLKFSGRSHRKTAHLTATLFLTAVSEKQVEIFLSHILLYSHPYRQRQLRLCIRVLRIFSARLFFILLSRLSSVPPNDKTLSGSYELFHQSTIHITVSCQKTTLIFTGDKAILNKPSFPPILTKSVEK